MVYEIIKNIKKGIGFALGILLIFGVVFGVYAFVEPSSGPSSNYYVDSSSSILVKLDALESKIDVINSSVSSSGGSASRKDIQVRMIADSVIRTDSYWRGGSTYAVNAWVSETDLVWGGVSSYCLDATSVPYPSCPTNYTQFSQTSVNADDACTGATVDRRHQATVCYLTNP